MNEQQAAKDIDLDTYTLTLDAYNVPFAKYQRGDTLIVRRVSLNGDGSLNVAVIREDELRSVATRLLAD